MSNTTMEKFKVNDIVLLDRSAAEKVLDKLSSHIENYGIATVSEFYEALGITGSYTTDKWGWKSTSGFEIVQVSGGYGFVYPELEPTITVTDLADDNIKTLADKTSLSVTVLKALFAQDYMFVEEMGKPYRFERRSL